MNNIDITEEALRIVYLERSATVEEEVFNREIEYILSIGTSVEMAEDKKNQLLSRLGEIAFSMSFGQILDKNIRDLEISLEHLAQETKLPLAIINELIGDRIYTNNVPIVMIKNLLTKLRIGFSTAEKGIKKTFELLQNSITEQAGAAHEIPAFRKGIYLPKDVVSGAQLRNDGRELYENKESLDKYIGRLEQLLK